MARTKKTNVKDIGISRTIDFTTATFQTIDQAKMQIVSKQVKLPGLYDEKEILPALMELGHMPATIPTVEATTSVFRWKLSKILKYGEEIKDKDEEVDEQPKTRSKKSPVKDIVISRTVDFTVATFQTIDQAKMQIVSKQVKLPGLYDEKEILPALMELGHMPATIPTVEATTSVFRWKLSKILKYGEEIKDVPEYVPGEEE